MKKPTSIMIVVVLAVLSCPLSSIAGLPMAPHPGTDWPVATPEAAGFRPGELEAEINALTTRSNPLSSLLIVKNGYLIFERYWGGFAAGEMTALYSATKSINSLVVGIAIDRGSLPGALVTIGEALPGYELADPRAATISLQDLLTMRAGFDYDEWSLPYGHPRNPYNAWAQAEDRTVFALSLPMAENPGTNFRYQTPASQLVPRILEKIANQNFVSLAVQWLFAPLGISEEHVIWRLDAQGHTRVAACNMVPADVARIGLLLLRGGQWNGERVVSKAWIDASITPWSLVRPGVAFGYHWWLREIDGLRVIGAEGYGGQCLFVMPKLDLVVVSTGRFPDGPEGAFRLLRDSIVPALETE